MKLALYVSPRGMQSILAGFIKVSPVLIHQWSTGKRRVPAEKCGAIEKATNGIVTKHELRPDVFDKPVEINKT